MPIKELNSSIVVLELEPVSDGGGVTHFIEGIAAFLPKGTFTVHFAASGNGEAFDLLQRHNVVTHQMDIDYSSRTFLARVKILRAFLQEQQIDIVHAHTVKAGFLAVRAAKGTAAKVVFTAHGWRFLQLRNPFKRAVLFLIERYIVRTASVTTYLTHEECAWGKKLAPTRPQYLVPLSLDITTYQSSSAVIENTLTVSMMGRIAFQKDPETFVKVAALVSKKIPAAHFIWIGDGQLREKMQRHILASGLSKIIAITGQLSHDKAVAALQQSTILLFTSRFEGLPIVVLEAMAASIPIVAARVSGIPEIIIEGKTGLLFEKGNETEAAEKIIALYNNPMQQHLYAENALALVKKEFSPVEKCAQKFAQIYTTLHETDH